MPKPEEKFDLRECLERLYPKRSQEIERCTCGSLDKDHDCIRQDKINYAYAVISKHYIPRDKVNKAVEVLGIPTINYMPRIAIREYDKKIKQAVEILLEKEG